MFVSEAKLFLVCGKIAAGKSTLCKTLNQKTNAILLVEDDWLSALYSDKINSVSDYVMYSGRLRSVIGEHVISLLQGGVPVVMDFPANTLENRVWLRSLGEQANVGIELHFLDVPDAVCKARMHRRNEGGDHPFVVSDKQFDQISSHFVRPSDGEGLSVVLHRS